MKMMKRRSKYAVSILLLPLFILLTSCDQATSPAVAPEISVAGADFNLENANVRGEVAAQLAQVRRHTAHYHRVENAEEAGYTNVNVGECVENPEQGGMGYHFVKFDLLDLDLDPIEPEILVYAPSPNGDLKLVAVEYAVPIVPWVAIHGENNPPMVLGQHLHANPNLGLYVLHAWIWKHNPTGIFEDWNPRVTCDYAPEPVVE